MAYGSVTTPADLTVETTRLAKMVLQHGYSQAQVVAALQQVITIEPAINILTND